MKLSEFLNIGVEHGKPLHLFDSNGDEVYYENYMDYWTKRKYDSNGNEVYFESSSGYWAKGEFDSDDNRIYYENSTGELEDNRPSPVVEMTMAQICEVLGKEVKIVK